MAILIAAPANAPNPANAFTLIDFARKRHGGRANVAFCDGHVVQGTLKRLCLNLDATALCRWNKDNAPHYKR